MRHPFDLTIADLESSNLEIQELSHDEIDNITGGSTLTTLAIGEEGGDFTTLAIGEEGGDVTSQAIGEEGGGFTTFAVGEEGGCGY